MKKIRKLVEEHLTQKDFFEEDNDLEEDSLVKTTVNDLLEGNIDDVSCEQFEHNSLGLKTKEFPLENTFSTKAYSGKKISRNSFTSDCDPFDGLSEVHSDNDEPKKKKKRKASLSEEDYSENSEVSNNYSSEDELTEEVSCDSDVSNTGKNEAEEIDEKPSKTKKRVKFSLPSREDGNSSNENISSDENEEDSYDDESEIEDDLSSDESTKDHSSFLYSKNFKNEPSEIDRGLAIRNQLSVWEILLESRIMLQKCLVASNKLPRPEMFDKISTQFTQEDNDTMIESREKVWDFLEKLILTQDKLRKQCYEFVENRKDDSSLNNSDDEQDASMKTKRRKLSEYPQVLEKLYNEFIPYRDSVIQKWNDRTKIASGKWAKSNFSAFDQPVLKQIEQIMSDKQRLIQRTFIKRSQYSIVGDNESNQEVIDPKNANIEVNREIFDDDDFYHKLLRDYIERKTSDISDPTQLGRKWIQLQSLRNKMRRKVDTRRTKGRKIKFDVYPKLVNFMAPVQVDCWEDKAINELYSSVFGKNILNT